MISFGIFVLITLLIYFHGQANTGIYPIRILTTITLPLIIGYITFYSTFSLLYTFIGSIICAVAVCYGPEIGWNKKVLTTQALKGACITASLFPIGLFYAVFRPLAYWVGYTKFSNNQDEIARILSGVFLGAVCILSINYF